MVPRTTSPTLLRTSTTENMLPTGSPYRDKKMRLLTAQASTEETAAAKNTAQLKAEAIKHGVRMVNSLAKHHYHKGMANVHAQKVNDHVEHIANTGPKGAIGKFYHEDGKGSPVEHNMRAMHNHGADADKTSDNHERHQENFKKSLHALKSASPSVSRAVHKAVSEAAGKAKQKLARLDEKHGEVTHDFKVGRRDMGALHKHHGKLGGAGKTTAAYFVTVDTPYAPRDSSVIAATEETAASKPDQYHLDVANHHYEKAHKEYLKTGGGKGIEGKSNAVWYKHVSKHLAENQLSGKGSAHMLKADHHWALAHGTAAARNAARKDFWGPARAAAAGHLKTHGKTGVESGFTTAKNAKYAHNVITQHLRENGYQKHSKNPMGHVYHSHLTGHKVIVSTHSNGKNGSYRVVAKGYKPQTGKPHHAGVEDDGPFDQAIAFVETAAPKFGKKWGDHASVKDVGHHMSNAGKHLVGYNRAVAAHKEAVRKGDHKEAARQSSLIERHYGWNKNHLATARKLHQDKQKVAASVDVEVLASSHAANIDKLHRAMSKHFAPLTRHPTEQQAANHQQDMGHVLATLGFHHVDTKLARSKPNAANKRTRKTSVWVHPKSGLKVSTHKTKIHSANGVDYQTHYKVDAKAGHKVSASAEQADLETTAYSVDDAEFAALLAEVGTVPFVEEAAAGINHKKEADKHYGIAHEAYRKSGGDMKKIEGKSDATWYKHVSAHLTAKGHKTGLAALHKADKHWTTHHEGEKAKKKAYNATVKSVKKAAEKPPVVLKNHAPAVSSTARQHFKAAMRHEEESAKTKNANKMEQHGQLSASHLRSAADHGLKSKRSGKHHPIILDPHSSFKDTSHIHDHELHNALAKHHDRMSSIYAAKGQHETYAAEHKKAAEQHRSHAVKFQK